MATKKSQMIIGYFEIRGKAQVPRLLCEYSNVQYTNKFYTPKQYIEEKKKNPNFSLPYLKKGQIKIYGPEQICYSIINETHTDSMLGKTEEDKVKVKMYCWSIDSIASIIGTNALKKAEKKELEKQWENNLKLKLKKYEKACLENGDWFLGYLTLIDFSVYELVRYMDWMFPDKMKVFSNLCRIKSRVEALPEIKAYESSKDSVSEMSPQKILQQLTNFAPINKNNKK